MSEISSTIPLSLWFALVIAGFLLIIVFLGYRNPLRRVYSLASIGCLIALFGLALTGDFDAKWLPYHNSGLGYSIFDVGLSGFIVFLFVDEVLNGSKRRKWKYIKQQTKMDLQRELNGIAADVIMVTGASGVAITSTDTSPEEETDALREATLARMRKLSEDTSELRASVMDGLFDRAFPELFSMRAERLQRLELRTWGDFLDPQEVGLMIDLERLLDTLETHLVIVAKDRKYTDKLSAKLAESYENAVYEDLQLLLKRILKGVMDGLITILP